MISKFFQLFACRLALGVFIAVWIPSFFITTYGRLFPPIGYTSTARIRLEGSETNWNLIQNQANVIRSPLVLNTVVEKLGLNKIWAQRYGVPFQFKTSDSLQILTNQLVVSPVKNSTVMEITSYSETPDETALIANCVAETYQDLEREKQIQVQIVDRAQPTLRPWKPDTGLVVFFVVRGIVFATFYGGVAAVLAGLVRNHWRKFIFVKTANPHDSNPTETRIKQKY